MQQQPQLQGVADLLANQGRYGDSMLVHMNPAEVQGLASMSPTGSLTVNPETGQPEAFILSLLGALATAGAGSVAGGALASGLGLGTFGTLATKAALTEGISALTQGRDFDPLKALASGATQFGVGAATDTFLSGADAAVDAANIAKTSGDSVFSGAASPESVHPIPEVAAKLAETPEVAQYLASMQDVASQSAVADMTLGEKFGEVVSRPGDAFKAISAPEALIPIGIGESTRLNLETADLYGDQAKDLEERKKAQYDRGVAQRDANVFDPNVIPDPFASSPAYGSDYSQYANAGGIVSLDPNDFRKRFSELQALDRPVVNMYGGGPFNIPFYGTGAGAGSAAINPIPANRQAALRDPFVISPEQLQQTYQEQGLPGFGPEIMYFTTKDEDTGRLINPNPFKDWVTPDPDAPPPEGGDGGDGGYSPPPAGDNPYGVADSSEEVQQAYSYGAPRDASASELAAYNLGAKDIDGDGRLTTEEFRQWEGYDSWAEQQGGRWGISGSTHPGGIPGSRFTGQRDSRGNEIYVMPDGATVTVDTFDDWAASSGIATYGSAPNGYRYTEADFNNFIKSGGIDANENNKIDPAEREAHKALLGGGTGGITEDAVSEEATTTNVLDGIDLSSLNLTPEQIASIGDTLANLQQTNYANYMNFGRNFGMQEGGETQIQSEADRLIDLAQMAVLGRLPEEEADVVIQAFIDEFGEEAFQALRNSTLEEVVPGSQKEGEVVGAGGGMDDLIPGMIGDQQPVAVSPGEYIVPADVVSGIGDGSTDAGVQQLDGMLDRVRMERTGTTQQPAPLAKGGMLPR